MNNEDLLASINLAEQLAWSLRNFNDEPLLIEIGKEVVVGARTPDDDSAAEIGRSWVSRHLSDVRKDICGDPAIRALEVASGNDGLKVAAAMLDFLAKVYGFITAFSLAVLVTHYGLQRFCANSDEQ